MEIEVLQENFISALQLVTRFVPSKASLPVLSMVLLKTDGGKLKLSATNMDTAVEMAIGASVEKEGGVVVPARLLADYINLLPAGKMKLTAEEGVLKLKAKSRKATFTGVEVSEFPELPRLKGGMEIFVDGKALEQVVELVSFAASRDESRPVLSALLVKKGKKNKLEVVATDGYRLSRLRKVECESGSDKGVEMLVSAAIIDEVAKIARDLGVEKVGMMVDDDQKSVVFNLESVVLTTRLVEGDYPAYEKILPKSNRVVLTADRDELLETTRAAAVFARDSSNIVKWVIEGERLVMSANASSVGEQEGEVAVVQEGEEAGEIAFNSRFLIDVLSNLDSEKIKFSMSEPLRPGMFETDDENFVHVIMPVRVQGS